ncbi:MAG: hypothetical protein ACFFCO_09475, partial [Promethearchaeota archaeon]
DISVEWDAWYNFRPKHTINVTYTLFLNDIAIDTGIVVYDKFWRPTNLTFNLGVLDDGQYNLTLSVTDAEGHLTSNSLNITIGPFHISREGATSIEVGHEGETIQWQGHTRSPLFFNLTVNSTLHTADTWNGDTITLNLESLEIGAHNVTLLLFNGTELVHTDSFWVSVYPISNPIIVPLQPSQIISTWNEELVLSWELVDLSPSSWSIYLNETVVASKWWTIPEFLLHWTLPVLDEDVYNITVVTIDAFGLSSNHTTWVTIQSPSPPAIFFISENTIFQWGQENATLAWRAHGGSHWTLYRNDTILHEESFSGHQIDFEIEHWQAKQWGLGVYNVCLHVTDGFGASTTNSLWIRISLVLGDPYANAFLPAQSQYYLFGDNAVGAPDSTFSLIFLDYGNGYLTLDMGFNEEILDGAGADFRVKANGGEYYVKVSNSLTMAFTTIDHGQSTRDFDLAGSGFASVRYIRIEYRDGDTIELDAIIAHNSNVSEDDSEEPEILGPEDFWVLETQASFAITWEVQDASPWNYSIAVNEEPHRDGPWNGTDITFNYEVATTGFWRTYNITLTLQDVCGNRNQDSVLVDVLPIDTEPPQVRGPEDFGVFLPEALITFVWEAYDLTPINYTITVNGELFQSGPWNGSDITLVYNASHPGTLDIQLTLWDFFNQQADDTVLVVVYSPTGGLLTLIVQLSVTIFIAGTCIAFTAILIKILRKPRTSLK